jgi:hypothetical protein
MALPRLHPDPPTDFDTVDLPLTRRARRWFRAIWGHPRKPQGILYSSRHNPKLLCAAIFDRAPVAKVKKHGSFLCPDMVARIPVLLEKYSVGLV